MVVDSSGYNVFTHTKEGERLNPSILNASRKKRIANGSGTEVSDVNKLVKQYTASKKMFKQFADMEKMSKMFKG